MSIDYKNMQVGDRVRFQQASVWAGANKDLYYEVQEYCNSLSPSPQFEVQTVRLSNTAFELWLKRIR